MTSTSENSFKANFRECPKAEVPRIPIPRTTVNKGKKEGRGLGQPRLLPHSCDGADGGYGPRGGGASPASKATIGGELTTSCSC